jgi:uncharacterized oxidoreductase
MNLSEHRVFVTGGTRGIGLALATTLTDRGAAVALCGRSEERLVEIRRRFPRIAALRSDLADLDALPSLAAELRSTLGPPTILVNNAGIQLNHSWPGTPASEVVDRLRREILVNLTSPLALTAHLLDDLGRAPAAAIVNVTSALALQPKRSAPVYCATKAALRSFTRALRYQLEAHPTVRVVEAVPPLVDTEMTEGRGKGKVSPAEVAEAIVAGLERDVDEIYVGKARVVRAIHRLAPGLAARLMRDS